MTRESGAVELLALEFQPPHSPVLAALVWQLWRKTPLWLRKLPVPRAGFLCSYPHLLLQIPLGPRIGNSRTLVAYQTKHLASSRSS